MTIDELLTELQVRYPDGATWRERVILTNFDILNWTASACMPRQDLYDQLAIGLARGFHASELSFEFCDTVVNEIHSVMIFMNEQRPQFFWQIYLAFDSGEYYHDGNRDEDPGEAYTRPQIERVLDAVSALRCSARSGDPGLTLAHAKA
ncbi:hypothetical protein CU102_27670 [Phyllobacterium brassicacearum]|uniref:Uncharacterized protein n=1 Tax=Phyllobacterium brassicacearum TaxID=314235 RepID=A0A2P7AYD5_9HYPH|nr:hypothetical protein [Phyllobacterium brassicacearum]PSH59230.1 hypothetical protein CU102_27670 [Phyllobacterium brassicacearum]TDQ09175.1 hypothetical protein DEV91_1555 [Phyllobacterium brassicacearum]